MNTKTIIKTIGVVIVVLAILGAYKYPTAQIVTVTGSPSGSTFGDAKIAAIVFNPATGTATSTSILNTDATDRWVTGPAFALCGNVGTSKTAYTGAGLASLIFQAATTSTASPASLGNVALMLNVIVSTSTPDSTISTSTFIGNASWQRWNANSYMTFTSNATNTAQCTVGINYVPS